MSSDASFYGDGAKVISSTLEINVNSRTLQSVFDIEEYYEISRSAEWLKSSDGVSRVALQFPDEMLADTVAVITRLQSLLPNISFFILADTSYGSCCVDTVAAQHYSADALIHYGSSCLSPSSSIPVLWVFGRAPLSIPDCCRKIQELQLSNQTREDDSKSAHHYVLMFDVQYDYIIDELYLHLRGSLSRLVRSHLRTCANSIKETTPADPLRLEVNGRSWCSSAASSLTLSDYDVIYIGGEGRTLTNLMMVMNQSKFYTYNPQHSTCREETRQINKSLMKRFYLIEKAKDANIIGIVVGTLAVSNYLLIHNKLKELIRKAGKKSYTIVVGKLNTAKLANFMEVDIFVLVACSENTLIDSAEFYKPVVTPFEMELAYNTEQKWDGDYVTDFSSLLPEGRKYLPLPETIEPQTDVSLLSGAMRSIGVSEAAKSADDKQISVREGSRALATTPAKTAGEYLTGRSWTGLEQDLGKTPIEKARQGQKGIAMGYEDEATS